MHVWAGPNVRRWSLETVALMERRQVLLKLEGLPVDTSNQDINRFFKDPEIAKEDISILRNESSKCVGIAYVRFHSQIEADSAARHCARSIHGSRVVFKETSIKEMVATKGKIDGKPSDSRVKSPVSRGSYGSSGSREREREETRRLPFSKFTSRSSGSQERDVADLYGQHRWRSRSPHHRHHRESLEEHGSNYQPQGENTGTRRTTHRYNLTQPTQMRSSRQFDMGEQSPSEMISRKRHVTIERGHSSSSQKDHSGRNWDKEEKLGVHHGRLRGEQTKYREVDRREVSGSVGYWKEKQGLHSEKPDQYHHSLEDNRAVEHRHHSSQTKGSSSSSRGRRGPVPTAVAKMYELKVLGFPSNFLYKEVRRALGPHVVVAHNGVEFVKESKRTTAYVLVVGESSYHAALERDGYHIDRHHTLTVLPANRAKETSSKEENDDLRDVLKKKQHRGDSQGRSRSSPVAVSKMIDIESTDAPRESRKDPTPSPPTHKGMEEPDYIENLWNSTETGSYDYESPTSSRSQPEVHTAPSMLLGELPSIDEAYNNSIISSDVVVDPIPFPDPMSGVGMGMCDERILPVNPQSQLLHGSVNVAPTQMTYSNQLTYSSIPHQHDLYQQQTAPEFIPLASHPLGSQDYTRTVADAYGSNSLVPQKATNRILGLSGRAQSTSVGLQDTFNAETLGGVQGMSIRPQDYSNHGIARGLQHTTPGARDYHNSSTSGGPLSSSNITLLPAAPLQKTPTSSALSSVVHIVNRPVSQSVSLQKNTTAVTSAAQQRATQLISPAGGRSCIMRISGAPTSVTIQDVLAFLQDSTVSFNNVRIQCSDLGQPTGKVFITYKDPMRAIDKVKKLSNTFFKKNKVTLEIV